MTYFNIYTENCHVYTLIFNIIHVKTLCVITTNNFTIPAIAAGSAYIIIITVAIIIVYLDSET